MDDIKILGEPSLDDIEKYKRGNKENIKLSNYYLCQRWCGNYWVPSKKNYKKGVSRSCGKHSNDNRFIDETGNIYGELKVVAPAIFKPRNDKHKMWICECSCGNMVIVSGKDLRNHKQNSCGCIKSKGVKLIQEILNEFGIENSIEYMFEDFVNENGNCYRFDWAIYKNGELFCLLEYDGEQHFDKTNPWYREDVDNIKDEYCKNNNINLYRISYKEYDKLNINYIKEKINYE